MNFGFGIGTRTIFPMIFGRHPDKLSDGASTPLQLVQLQVQQRVNGHFPLIHQIAMTMTFRNMQNIVLEGAFEFTLPENATICGYGLDIDGEVVDGVVIEKQAARIIFEKEVRKRIDPGFVELVTGNVFRTRVYPINPQSTRTVRVIYQDQAIFTNSGYRYEIPVIYQTQLQSLDIILTCFGSDIVKPYFLIDSNNAKSQNPEFISNGNGEYKAEWHLKNVAPPVRSRETISYILSNSIQPIMIAIEKDARVGAYFAISYALPRVNPPHISGLDIPSITICILWDASISRSNSSENRLLELNAFKKIFDIWLNRVHEIQIIIHVFRNDLSQQIVFQLRSHNWNDFMNIFKDLAYDGATNLLQLSSINITQPINYYFLCSDCISTLHNVSMQENSYANIKAPIWILNGNPTHEPYDVDFVRYLTQYNEFGGGYLDYNKLQLNGEDLLNMIEGSQIKYLGYLQNSSVSAVYPSRSISIPLNSDRFLLVGQIPVSSTDKVTLELEFSLCGQTSKASTILDTSSNDSRYFGLIRRLWAQQRLNELNPFKDRYKSEIISLGLEYSVVSHFTSLLVLETLEQHLQYNVCPAPSRKLLYERYLPQQNSRKNETDRTISSILRPWNQICEWYTRPAATIDHRSVTFMPMTSSLFNISSQQQPTQPLFAPIPPRFTFARSTTQIPISHSMSSLNTFESSFGGSTATASAPTTTSTLLPSSFTGFSPQHSLNSNIEDTSSIILTEQNSRSSSMMRISQLNNPMSAYLVYLNERQGFRQSPSFYFEIASYFLSPKSYVSALDKFNQKEESERKVDDQSMEFGLRILTNILELELEAAQLYRMVAYKLMELGQWTLALSVCQKIYSLRPDEPQALCDLALISRELGQQDEAMKYFKLILKQTWDPRFSNIYTIALLDLNSFLVSTTQKISDIDQRLIRHLPFDIRIVVQWDTADTSILLHITEPNGQTLSSMFHNQSRIGGYIETSSNSFQQPVQYLLRKAIDGSYKISVHLQNNAQHTLIGVTTVMIWIYKYFGTIKEEKQIKTVRLSKINETVEVGRIQFGDPTLKALQNELEKTKEECLRLQNLLIGSKENASKLSQHLNITCDGCSQSPIIGDRYKCMFCPNLDFCERCQSSTGHLHDSQHPLICIRDSSLYASSIHLQNNTGSNHLNTQCASCSVSPIVGILYRCTICSIYLCGKCEFLCLHDVTHQRLKIFVPG